MTIAGVASGGLILASKINEIIDAVNRNGQLQFRGSSNTTQSLANSTWADVLLQAEEFDVDNGHSTVSNTARYTFQRTGYFVVAGNVFFSSGTTGRIGARLLYNGATVVPQSKTIIDKGAINVAIPMTGRIIKVTTALDYVTMQAFQETGGAINIGNATAEDNSQLNVWYMGPL